MQGGDYRGLASSGSPLLGCASFNLGLMNCGLTGVQQGSACGRRAGVQQGSAYVDRGLGSVPGLGAPQVAMADRKLWRDMGRMQAGQTCSGSSDSGWDVSIRQPLCL